MNDFLADPGEARGCSTKKLCNSFIDLISNPFPPTGLRRRHAQAVRYSNSSYKTDYVIVIKIFLHPKGHQNPISGSEVTVILLKGWILSIGGVSAGESLCLQPAQQACFHIHGLLELLYLVFLLATEWTEVTIEQK